MSEPRGTGNSSKAFRSSNAPSSGSLVSKLIGLAPTTTDSVATPGLRSASTEAFLPTSMLTLLLTQARKPDFSIFTVYVPGIRSVTVYVPTEPVTAWLTTPVPLFVMVTVAPGTTAPDSSITVPWIPLKAWAWRRGAEEKSKRQTAKTAGIPSRASRETGMAFEYESPKEFLISGTPLKIMSLQAVQGSYRELPAVTDRLHYRRMG